MLRLSQAIYEKKMLQPKKRWHFTSKVHCTRLSFSRKKIQKKLFFAEIRVKSCVINSAPLLSANWLWTCCVHFVLDKAKKKSIFSGVKWNITFLGLKVQIRVLGYFIYYIICWWNKSCAKRTLVCPLLVWIIKQVKGLYCLSLK